MSTPNGETRPRKSLILNAFVEMCSGHQSPGLWKHPEDESWRFNDLDHWIELAKLLEGAKFHGMFIADVLGMSLACYMILTLTYRAHDRWL